VENTKYVTSNDGTRLPTYLVKTAKKGLMQAGVHETQLVVDEIKLLD
jgi:hypothetical protein